MTELGKRIAPSRLRSFTSVGITAAKKEKALTLVEASRPFE
jgi:hypothetical protein